MNCITYLCAISTKGEFGEAQVIRAIANTRPFRTAAFIGNSLPVRLVRHVCPCRLLHATTYTTNRGASGIDGLLATACGIAAHKANPPV